MPYNAQQEEVVILTKQEIGDAICNYIGTFKKGMAFFPYRISDTDQPLDIPENVMSRLEYIPKGTKSREETKHAL